ncbi:MAG: hypothetical protein MJZ46_00660 [Bacteroidales bacterium]|nr:hypothetical protein [Bacteroidales bacterium]
MAKSSHPLFLLFRIIPFNLVEIPVFPPYVRNIGMAMSHAYARAAAQHKRLRYV